MDILGLIHQSPERKWRVQELDEAALSSSAFTTRFTELVGEDTADIPHPMANAQDNPPA